MDNNCGKKYRPVASTLNVASAYDIAVDANHDVELGCLSNYKDSDIIRLEDGHNVIDILGSLQVRYM